MQFLGYGRKYPNTQNCLAARAIEQLGHYTSRDSWKLLFRLKIGICICAGLTAVAV